MIDFIPLNVASIKVIRNELNASIQKASHHFEAFVADRSAVDQLNECRACLADVVGILKMLEMPGAEELSQEMLALLDKCLVDPARTPDFTLSALSHAFVGIPCYIEYVVDREQAAPALLLTFINQLRAAQRKPITFESTHAQYQSAVGVSLQKDGAAADDLAALVKRLRQMYQMGLIGLIREENIELKLQLMHRSMARLAEAVGGAEIRTQWRLTEAVIEAMLSGALELTFTRKRTLALLDAEMRKFEQAPDTTDSTATPELLTELVFLVNLAGSGHPASVEVREALQLTPFSVNDSMLQQERDVMQGPNADTILTMVKALRDELAQSKEVLEIAAQDMSGSTDFSPLVSLFQRVADILAVVGLKTPGQILSDMHAKVKSWAEGGEYNKDDLLGIADGLLYVESNLSNLSRLDLNFREVDLDEESKRSIMARSQLDEAQRIVIEEAQAGIALAKKDINSFIESDFDMGHIANVVENLVSVRGGLLALKLDKAAAVLASCITFIENTVANGVDESSAGSVLETMADALISLEYYLSEMQIHGDVPLSVLAVAEQSLAALGYPVE